MTPDQDSRVPAPWSGAEVREALGLGPRQGTEELHFPRVTTDTRTLREGDLFVALEGPTFDGHDFLSEAAARGAAGAIVHRSAPSEGLLTLFPVDDTLTALGALARHRRRTFAAPVVAITGSSGKTTVKELLGAALRSSFRLHLTPANLNNRIGLPLTLLATPVDTEVVVVELGTNEPGEIGALTAIAEPDAALLTTVSEAHLERLESLEGVYDEKLALVRGVPADGWIVVGDEPPELPTRVRELHGDVTVTGLSPRADERWRGELVDADAEGRWRVRLPAGEIECRMPGRHGARNTLLALAAAERLGVPFAEAVRTLEETRPSGLRGESRTIGKLTLILDCYNANPQSTRAALGLLVQRPSSGPRVAILGSMLELGDRAGPLHDELLTEALGARLDLVVAVGDFARAAERLDPASDSPTLLVADDADEAFRVVRPHLSGTETILLKGSRGVELEQVVPHLEEAFGSTAAPESTPTSGGEG
ncbi:MAG: UDP-N-acetylmuramoyl-tripeptide--D-alanyl-D-alanine ligase [Gemmatimonadales bacterium]|nr:MAG: UDP-N-acetylmuramoyl-tripeptide--D-alanyl-D-alanine ligase [Gemmatimonadales bacterium]